MTTNETQIHVQSLDNAREGLFVLKRIHKTWRAVSVALGSIIPPGTLCAIAKGRDPKKPEYRRVLNLAPLDQLAPTCPRCGVVHIKACHKTRKPPTRWADMPVRDVRWGLDNREVMP